MKNVLIVYCSRYGQTEKIVNYLRSRCEELGAKVTVVNTFKESRNYPIDASTDTVFVGAPVFTARFPGKLVSWIHANKGSLQGKTSALFTVSLNAADVKPEARIADEGLLAQFVTKTGWTPGYAASVAGGLAYTHYGWFIRYIMKRISSAKGGPIDTAHDHELTDWSVVDGLFAAVANRDWNSKFNFSLNLLKNSAQRIKVGGSVNAEMRDH